MKPEKLVDLLAAHLGADVAAGTGAEGTIECADGLVAEVRLLIRRRPTREAVAAYKTQFLAWLDTVPWASETCQVEVNPGGKWHSSRPAHRCRNRVTAAVVFSSNARRDRRANVESREGDPLSFLCICGVHRESHGVKASDILGIVDLSALDLLAAERARAVARAVRTAKSRVEDQLEALGVEFSGRYLLLDLKTARDDRLSTAVSRGLLRPDQVDAVRRVLVDGEAAIAKVTA